MMQPGIEPSSPGPLANTLPTNPAKTAQYSFIIVTYNVLT